MKAKEFVKEIKKLDRMIVNKIIEKARWEAIATSTTVQLGERVQSSSDQHKMERAIIEGLSYDDEIKALRIKRSEIIHTIEQLNANEYDILHKMYVQNLTFDEVADEYERSYSWCTTLHGKALKSLQDILDGGGNGITR